MGAGGVAMGALAGALLRRGLKVQGSDRPLYPPMSTFLEDLGIPVAAGYAPANLDGSHDLVIVGNVIRRDNPEVERLAELGLHYLSLPQALAHFFIQDKTSIVVAGTHGKTTTTGIIASGLINAGQDPGFMVGGLMMPHGENFRDGGGECFVVEGDEYDTAFFDKRPKFVHYRPRIGLFTSCEFDHADIYADFAAVARAFAMFVDAIPSSGVLIAWGDSPQVMELAQKAACPVLSYGTGEDNAWRLLSALPAPDGGAQLKVRTPQGQNLDFFTPLVGEHNALNTVAACAALCAAGLAPGQAARVQADFGGMQRRQQIRGEAGGVMVVDDFAHHPTAVRETVKAAARFGLPGWKPASLGGGGRLVAVFEPRTNTSKRNFFQDQYASAFKGADLVFLREPPDVEDIPQGDRFSSQKLAQALQTRGMTACAYPHTDQLLDALAAELKAGDLCLIMSNGGFDRIHQRLLERLK